MAKSRTNSGLATVKGSKPTREGLLRVQVTLTSTGPGMLMNPMGDELLEELAGVKAKSASLKDLPLADRAERKVIRGGPKNLVGIPITYLLSALIYSGKYIKNGKWQISTTSSTTLFEFLSIDSDFLPFTNQDEKMVVDMRRGVSSSKGSDVAVAVVRPLFKRWTVRFGISIDTNIASEDTVRQLFVAAGLKAGVGDFRPMKRGPFGMFNVEEWRVLKG